MFDDMAEIDSLNYDFFTDDNQDIFGSLDQQIGFPEFNLASGYDSGEFENIGDPDSSGWIGQTTDFTCAVVSQQMIISEFGVEGSIPGQPPSEAELTYVAATNGWLDGGTYPEDMGKLLELYGIDCHHGSGFGEMTEELGQGHKIIVGVDAEELWKQDNALINDLKDFFIGERANHAIVGKGITRDIDGDPMVVVNDPGDPGGAGKEYSMDVFRDAFEDSGCHYVATNEAPPNLGNDEIFGANFDHTIERYTDYEQWEPSYLASIESSASTIQSLENMSVVDRINIFRNI